MDEIVDSAKLSGTVRASNSHPMLLKNQSYMDIVRMQIAIPRKVRSRTGINRNRITRRYRGLIKENANIRVVRRGVGQAALRKLPPGEGAVIAIVMK